jgi:hypothetical protein
MKKKFVDKTRNNSSDMRSHTDESNPIIKKGVLNPESTIPAKGEIGTQDDSYEHSGLDEIVDGESTDLDEEDDTRLGSV